jgi:hypothetical protein
MKWRKRNRTKFLQRRDGEPGRKGKRKFRRKLTRIRNSRTRRKEEEDGGRNLITLHLKP